MNQTKEVSKISWESNNLSEIRDRATQHMEYILRNASSGVISMGIDILGNTFFSHDTKCGSTMFIKLSITEIGHLKFRADMEYIEP